MQKSKKQFISFMLSTIIFGFLFFLIPSNVMAVEKINLGMIDSSASKMISRFTPLLEYIEAKGIPTGKVVVTKDVKTMTKRFNSGKVQMMFESPYGALAIMDGTGALPVLIREKSGVKEYNSVIFVPKSSSIKTIKDLVGKRVAFEDPASTSSFFLPKSILEDAGLELKKSRKAVPGKVAYYFSKDDDNTIAQVKAGKRADAGGIKKGAVADDSELRLLTPESIYVPRHVTLIHKDVSSDTLMKLKKVLLGMKNDPKAKSVLKKIKTPTGFSEFTQNPSDVMNKQVRKVVGL